ncbi:hypothetical protein LOZ12_005560 [Ophidiomyces ophidiicola]|uniref:Uncharacterized protein n=1 Tax=Ophidiomyces ophidiicola TaxID=1387563 RepID=A0ACB8UVP0_9EURO|nr:hypothetical protein LOZ64_005993 [Ophidiomyces ophidiicola]KAI1946298.1 hypothetical protein LOZ62_003408 [Ophidiomyces ophidiicola]KAI1950131.1 hypothetical protein LOZ59_005946 [Ophidiomyces ophidiicola]KAI1967942.1 hypothetical protein LOZ56_005317 [Ophidiomyces ophidiicola]KAI2001414.1 hypothetical protein LOZ50_005710 [Ophidiomyces ophidiicola]
MSTSAADIITYIGVPLAVLGVLPIIYTCIRALLILRSIRHALARNGHSDSAVTRGSMMSGVVEVELPRCTITPLDRDLDPEYWKINPERSSLKGGTWSFFHWNRLITGKKLYRIQYKDELRVPQAEIEFHELVSFLLDRGAVPDENGWSMLRTSGLWTPTGTVLLRPPKGKFGGVLRIGIPDDSDGVLSLMIHWSSDWDSRNKNCLPPFWMRIRKPSVIPALSLNTDEENNKSSDCIIEIERSLSSTSTENSSTVAHGECVAHTDDSQNQQLNSDNELKDETETHLLPSLLASIENKGQLSKGEVRPSDSIRFRLEGDTIDRIYFEHANSLTGVLQDISSFGEMVAQWFVYGASSLAQAENSGTGNVALPSDIIQAVQRDTVPCGMMEMLGMMQEQELPLWSSPKPSAKDPWKHHRHFMENQRQAQLEKSMPAAQAEAARLSRERATIWRMQDDYRESQRTKQEYEEKRLTEAVNSPKLSNEVVAKACLAWLIAQNDIPKPYNIIDSVRAILYLMVLDSTQAKLIAETCDRWMVWSRSGLNVSDITRLQDNKNCFCYAALMVYTMQTAAQSDGKVSTHMQECLGLWKKVRLG